MHVFDGSRPHPEALLCCAVVLFGSCLSLACLRAMLQIVEHGGYILEKPDDVEHARRVLERYPGLLVTLSLGTTA